ncbi:MAG: hypothetical protein PUJ51_03805 [Clostridiales bacterium]|nr:hypothetical protein [Clostridiales bacterium]
MISISDIKFISKEADLSSFYFVRNNTLFLFEVTEATVDWFTNWKSQFKSIDKVIVMSSIYHTNVENPYLKQVIQVLSKENEKQIECTLISGDTINNGKPVNSFIIKTLFKNKVYINTIRDIHNERIDFIIYDNLCPEYTIYYSGINIGRNLSIKLDKNAWENPSYYKNYSYLIFNAFNKSSFLGFSNYVENIVSIFHGKFNYPYTCTIIGLNRIKTNAIEVIEKKLKEISFDGIGKGQPERSIYNIEHDSNKLS